jgi:hypothetical protein
MVGCAGFAALRAGSIHDRHSFVSLLGKYTCFSERLHYSFTPAG